MTETEYAEAVAKFLARKNVTRCPTVCVAATRASVAENDRMALRNYAEAREAARMARLQSHQHLLAS